MQRPPFWLVVFGAATVLSLVGPLAQLVSDGWWFASIGYGAVFRRVLLTEIGLGLVGGLLAILIVGGSARFAARWNRPRPIAARPPGPRLATRDPAATPWPWARISPVLAADGVTVLVALVSAATAAGSWQQVLLALEGGTFAWRDPVWNLDARFYVFDLVLLQSAFRWLAALLAIAFVVSAATYVALGTVRVTLVQQDGQLVTTGVHVPPEVQRHVGSLVAALLAVSATLSYLGRYAAMVAPSGLLTGPGYADLHATLPLLTAEAVGTAICAFLAFVAIGRGSLAGIGGVALILVLLKATTTLVPGMVQRFAVAPNELSREGPQINHHIAATRYAFGLGHVEERPLSGKAEITQADIERNGTTIENVRLWDHEPLLEAFSQVQEIRTYYGFVGVDNDRYTVDGHLRQLMLSPRELTSEALPTQARTWVNETMIYTHGYGVALGPVNKVGAQGLPELYVQDLPPKIAYPDDLGIDRPEIYFGEATRHPVVVGTANAEFDYPSGDENAYTRYAGSDGVRLGWFGRLVFAVRLGSSELLFSSDVSSDAKVLMYRNVVDRARRIAPFLQYDADPYLVIDEGRLVWVLDAYTVSSQFPYAAVVEGIGNYVRNPVKVTVDAYDGTATFWRTTTPDPIADTWDVVFPGLFHPIEAMPASLAAHLRYPIDLFAAQASLFATYHMQDYNVFYNREDDWEIPAVDNLRMAPYFTIMRLPGEEKEEFLLMLPFSPKGKPNLSAWMVARSDGAYYGQLRVYKFPKDTMVWGPQMVAARIHQDDTISEKLSLWGQQGSEVDLGTLLVVPIEESLIYVQPLYLKAAQGSIPELKRVIVAYEDQIAMMPTLEEGLARLFGAAPPEAAEAGMTMPAVTTTELVRQAGLHWDIAQFAMQRGDWAEYGVRMQLLGEALTALRSGLGVPKGTE